MTDQELEKFELQLRRSKPAKPPEEFAAHLLAAEPKVNLHCGSRPAASPLPDYLRMLRQSLRWLIPATAAALVAVVVWHASLPSAQHPASPALSLQTSAAAAVPPVLTADDVKIDQQLVSSFDAVARLPGGEPVRFRCENWMDQVVLSDKARGVVVENRTPRFEVVALGFETY